MDTILKDLISIQRMTCSFAVSEEVVDSIISSEHLHDMLVTEAAATGIQALYHTRGDTASAAASCFYKHKLMNDIKAPHKRSDFNHGIDDLWHNKYYGASPPALTGPGSHFSNVDHTKQYHSLPFTEQVYQPNHHLQNYHQPAKQMSYYPHPAIPPIPAIPASSSSTQAVFQWQHSIQQQQHTSQQLQQRLSHQQLTSHGNQGEGAASTPSNSKQLTDIFLRNHQHHAGYLLSLNDNPSNWYQSPISDKDGLCQPPITKNICTLCGKNYARPSTLKTHMRIHSGERPFHCKVCNKSFSQAANLTAHLRVHSGEKPFSCPICHKTFSQSSSVTTHMRTHSGDRPYKCPVCRKGFSDSSTLTKHLRIHSGEKPYRCNYCSMSFSQSGNLNRHMKVHENQHKPESTVSSPSSSLRRSPNQ